VRAALSAMALSLSCWSAAAFAQDFEPARFIPLAVTILRVEAPTDGGQVKVGTAITVAPGVVVTNCHVTRDAVAVRVAKQAGRWPAEGQFADAEHDLCFLSVPTWPGRPIRFAAPDSLRLYQPVVAMGFTRGADVSMTPGEITGLHRFDGGRIIQSTSSFSSGASGGALLDAEGSLVGVLTFRLRGNIDHYFSIPASWVAARLPIAAGQFRPIGTLEGRAFWEADLCCTPHFMRVGGLQSQGKWPELLSLADEWIAADPADADAWFARGIGHARLRHEVDAAEALERAVTLAPRNADAWFELGAMGVQTGDAGTLGRALDVLAGLNSGLARRLQEMAPAGSQAGASPAPCKEECPKPAR
jgi:serine protease Do